MERVSSGGPSANEGFSDIADLDLSSIPEIDSCTDSVIAFPHSRKKP